MQTKPLCKIVHAPSPHTILQSILIYFSSAICRTYMYQYKLTFLEGKNEGRIAATMAAVIWR